MVDVRVTVDLGGVEKKVSPQAMKRGKLAAGSEALLIMDSSVPLRAGGGALRASGRVEPNGDASYNTVYARAQFYGTNGIVVFRKYTTAGTGKRWDKPLKANINRLKRAAIKGMGL
ncbi:minor capsid protein [Streptococcus anginosus]|nr:minor capsid protein [Streptococcus anginosus]MED5825236.1 minor capsid protein [Streptococcus anginosus]MED5853054.1 minor capsid protein [Streptococcus anginosus]MED5896288.1 minor capsid protein [Streptococcus anginosus]MED5898285.1 minor capsid protein [Streptococcus anginosus]